MSTPQKDWFAKWLPVVISFLTSLAILGVAWGKNEQWKVSIAKEVAAVSRENLVSYLVTRREYEQRALACDQQNSNNREDHAAILAKLDRLIERMK